MKLNIMLLFMVFFYFFSFCCLAVTKLDEKLFTKACEVYSVVAKKKLAFDKELTRDYTPRNKKIGCVPCCFQE